MVADGDGLGTVGGEGSVDKVGGAVEGGGEGVKVRGMSVERRGQERTDLMVEPPDASLARHDFWSAVGVRGEREKERRRMRLDRVVIRL